MRGDSVEDFLVLGIVPNTNIQITFEGWLVFAQVVVLLILLTPSFHRHISAWHGRYLERRMVRMLIENHSL